MYPPGMLHIFTDRVICLQCFHAFETCTSKLFFFSSLYRISSAESATKAKKVERIKHRQCDVPYVLLFTENVRDQSII